MKKVYLVAAAHIDPMWHWEFEEGASCALSTFASALNLQKDFDYPFNHGEANLYEWVEEYDPGLFKDIQKAVKEGKWNISGGWYLQPDCMLPCGESIVRQLQYGKEYFLDKFGYFPSVATNFDPFGHSRGLVQIMKKCGQDAYVFMRPFEFEKDWVDEQFIWEGYDGSRIKAARCFRYNTTMGHARECAEIWGGKNDKHEKVLQMWGVGNHGGGPSRKDLTDLATLIKEGKDIEYKHSTLTEFFNDIEPTYVCKESLIPSMPGCYTSSSDFKTRHIEAEKLLLETEKICSMASLKMGMDYPKEELKDATKDLLFSEFHDILPGDAIKDNMEYGIRLLDRAMREYEKCKAKAFFALAKNFKKAAEGAYPLFVFSSSSRKEHTLVEGEWTLPAHNLGLDDYAEITVKDINGNVLVSQNIAERSMINSVWRLRVAFMADLEPMSMNRFDAFVTIKQGKSAKKFPPVTDDVVYKSEGFSIRISKKTGLLESFILNGKEYAGGGLFAPYIYEDHDDPWGMGKEDLKHLGKNGHPLPLLNEAEEEGPFKGLQPIQLIEDGPVMLRVESFFKEGENRARVCYTINKEEKTVDVHASIYSIGVSKMFKLAVPLKEKGEYFGEQIFGQERLHEDGRESASQRFQYVDFGEDKVFGILNKSTYGSCYEDGTICLSLLRHACYCAHPMGEDRPLVHPNRYYDHLDQGQRDYHYRIGTFKKANLPNEAKLFLMKPFALNVFPTDYHIPEKQAAFALSNPEIELVAFKQREKNGTYVARLFNNDETSKKSSLTIGDASIELSFGKFEVKTVIYDVEKNTLQEIEEMVI